ncbi:xanthine dehydrogenase family protein molybdopterin-binding subunit [Natrarchaeobius oligotrophus]|uniref:Xanthine dehydrogenase family protein molybdopterin-binding subunit n=1 Tax=Natrarchaeobius chitinivorans TaxID=1679083 RepID=A0A3N6PKT7_NATCH|nr:molybdopterin cofactor-binding domain-containing protein [Natrarchaeobius chitinivorans]RQG99445.1 xanthine dehydrogenase family protein molybdopterin-binding subunit [Natrarchaeobius chitinivorans]
MTDDEGPDGGVLGAALDRREDPSLLTGEAKYTDDITHDGMLHMSVVRCPYGHAKVERVDASEAEAHEDVELVLTPEDLAESDLPGTLESIGMMVPKENWPMEAGPAEMFLPDYPLLAGDRALHQGHPVAVVVATDRYVANDATELVDVEYERLDAVANPAEATEDDAPALYEGAPDNVIFDWELGDPEAVDEAFESADHTVDIELEHPRVIPDAIEPRATIADFDPLTEKLTVEMTSQNPHHHRLWLSNTLDYPEHKIRIVAPEVGGGFGVKIHHYPEEALTSWCSMELERPVKWVQKRSEAHMTDAHARGHVTEASMALDDDGTILGLQADTHAALGAYVSTHAPLIPTGSYGMMLPGPFDVPAMRVNVIGTFTNTSPVDAYRGAGQPEATFVIQRLLEMAARDLDIDSAEIRRRNFIPPEEFPYAETVGNMVYDSGDYEKTLEKALEIADYDQYRQRQKELRDEDRYVGIGIASFVELTGLGPSKPGVPGPLPTFHESSLIRFHPSGTVTAYSGTADQGQGHKTAFAQVVAEELGVPYEDVEVIQGDTDQVPQGTGAFASRSAVVGGNAMAKSAEKIVEKATKIAAHQFEADEDDVVFEDGEFSIKGAPERSISMAEIAHEAHQANAIPDGMEPGLDATTFFDPDAPTIPFGSQVCIVEVDPESGEIDFLEYVAVDDCGEQINPQIVKGQIHGGIAQGLGPALFEEGKYDDNASLVSGTLMDYALPKANQLPDYDVECTVTPSPTNELGLKGIGEAGTIPAPTALVNAVVDALEPFGVDHVELPATPEKVWRAVEKGGEQ